MDLSVQEKAIIAISALKLTLTSLHIQKDRAMEIVTSLQSRIDSIQEQMAKLES